MILVTFRSRLREEDRLEYAVWAQEMDALVHRHPGFISAKTFVAADGERVTLAEFESEEAVLNWRNHPEHGEAQRLGRERFYTEYRVQVSSVIRDYDFVTAETMIDPEQKGR